MIKWTDEELAGEPLYNLLDGDGQEIFRGVRFRAANAVTARGTPFSARNMDELMHVTMPLPRIFCYDGAAVPTVPMPQAACGLQQGVILAICAAGAVLTAQGTLYLFAIANNEIQILTSPVGHKVQQDCVILCQVGQEVFGNIWYINDGGEQNGN